MAEINIPFTIAGELKKGSEQKEEITFKDKKTIIHMPSLSSEDIDKIGESYSHLESLHKLSLKDITDFFEKVRQRWNSSQLKKEAIENLTHMTGYSKEMVELSMQQIDAMISKNYIESVLDYDLGNKHLIDEWIGRGEAFVHCQPRGTLLHILAGNAPVISIMSLMSGIMTKNANIVKLPSRDLVTLSYFVQIFAQVDPNHPITKSTSVVYWPSSDNETTDSFISMANAICVWGDLDAIHAIKSKPHINREVISFGPRRGIHLIGKEVHTSKEIHLIAQKAAHDLVVFDQEGCFSPQLAFIEGSRENAVAYANALQNALDEETKKFPKGAMTLQQAASITHARAYSSFLGHHVAHRNNFDYTIIVPHTIEQTRSHPLGRTIFLIPVKELKDAVPHIGGETQVVAVEPFHRAKELREELTIKGVDRITHLGKMAYFAHGAPHEGIYPLSRLVRWVKSR
jgi:long-chain-fatty-acyl-CoA reductase